MKQFMDEDFLLESETAKWLFHDVAEKMPIVDYHCHIDPKEIAEDRKFKNITGLWLGGDHYKWRLMRANGVEEKYITGDAPDREKFQKWAETLEKAIGNPLYHWSHLELQRYFGYRGALNGETAEEVWNLCNARLQDADMSARQLVIRSNVKLLCTTDDPADDLRYHKLIREDASFPVKVLPAWRPDNAMKIEKPGFTEYLERLGKVSGVNIRSFEDLKSALKCRMDYFAENGCSLSDHGPDYAMYQPATEEEIEAIFARRLSGETLSKTEEFQYKTAFLIFVGREYARRNWVMQLHYGCKRDNNKRVYRALGPDTGFDAIDTHTPSAELAELLNTLAETEELPKTILYSLNPNDNAAIDTVMGCFQDSTAVGKIQHGNAWWFNDHKQGMTDHLVSLANLGVLGNHIGMLTDSRCFISYTRHEYFRRILCNLLGSWVENGEYPRDEKALRKIVEGICYDNAVRYFEFDV